VLLCSFQVCAPFTVGSLPCLCSSVVNRSVYVIYVYGIRDCRRPVSSGKANETMPHPPWKRN
jgi:hypothetical protein